ncbi:GspH/FimT family pseudopilin [Halomonas mongoliensis]|uniref:GspH/FimT family pseudopilin n=1 Tax=Halomonas mongoliensis TaxID=321265 RepID=UPI00403A8E98
MPLPPCKLGDSASIQRSQGGLTLIELLVALVVMIIMVGWAVPSYQRMAARQEVASEVHRLKTALAMTRSAAITRRTQVTLCPTVDMTQCQVANNAQGDAWRATLAIFEGQGVSGDPVLRTFGESRVERLTYRNDNLPVRYGALGRAGGHFGTFRICGRLDQGARVIVNIMGRVRVDSAPSEC